MEKKSYAPKNTKYIQSVGGLNLETCYPAMNCKFCDKKLTDSQVYEYQRGKTKGFCSRRCGNLAIHYDNIAMVPEYNEKGHKIFEKICTVCNEKFKTTAGKQQICSFKCAGVISSSRMKTNNPMKDEHVRKKVSNTLKSMNWKPIKQGGNGRMATVFQLELYNLLSSYDDSFVIEYIESTKGYRKEYKTPSHYKIDIASKYHKIAIEIDGFSHNALKVKECDNRKTKVLSLKGWKVLRFTNLQIQKELENCVQMVLSMI